MIKYFQLVAMETCQLNVLITCSDTKYFFFNNLWRILFFFHFHKMGHQTMFYVRSLGKQNIIFTAQISGMFMTCMTQTHI